MELVASGLLGTDINAAAAILYTPSGKEENFLVVFSNVDTQQRTVTSFSGGTSAEILASDKYADTKAGVIEVGDCLPIAIPVLNSQSIMAICSSANKVAYKIYKDVVELDFGAKRILPGTMSQTSFDTYLATLFAAANDILIGSGAGARTTQNLYTDLKYPVVSFLAADQVLTQSNVTPQATLLTANLATGVYRIRAQMMVLNADGAAGVKFAQAADGTLVLTTLLGTIKATDLAATPPALVGGAGALSNANLSEGLTVTSTTTGYILVELDMTITVSVAGVLTLKLSQGTSTASVTTLKLKASNISVQKLA